MPVFHRDVAALGQSPTDDSGQRGGTAGEGFAHNVQRVFPEQGWWCSEFEEWLSPARAERGYTIVLPGVEGTSCRNISIARGLVEAGHPAAIEVRDWTTGHIFFWPYHLMAFERNRQQAQDIARQIVAYQDRYPDRPVTLIGHSGGAAMAVLILEAASGRPAGDAGSAAGGGHLSRTRSLDRPVADGVRDPSNFHSKGDVGYLVLGTLALGTIDRQHSISAGASGFRLPAHLTDEQRQLYASHLQQVPYQLSMLRSYNLGGHFSVTNSKFVAEWVAPRLAVAGAD